MLVEPWLAVVGARPALLQASSVHLVTDWDFLTVRTGEERPTLRRKDEGPVYGSAADLETLQHSAFNRAHVPTQIGYSPRGPPP